MCDYLVFKMRIEIRLTVLAPPYSCAYPQKSCKIPKEESDTMKRRRRDNTMVKRKTRQTNNNLIIPNIKLKIEKLEPHLKPMVSSGTSER
jgi:hypothetical protein